MNLTSAFDIHINGLIASSGLGPVQGAGSPGSTNFGQGGTYGGSGGRLCNNTHYSDVTSQIGTVDVLEDLYAPYSYVGPSMGSGGGKKGAGQGGGRIILAAKRNVFVCDYCSVEAEGSEATEFGAGAGSGGSITVIAKNFLNRGEFSVKGGDHVGNPIFGGGGGGGGGGGRISINVSIVGYDGMVLIVFCLVAASYQDSNVLQ